MKCTNGLLVLCLLFFCSSLFGQSIGHTSKVFYDSARDRNIETEIYYPANESGDETPLAEGKFPVLVFGHGFVMTWEAYPNFWETLVPEGYVLCFATSEGSLFPSHEDFGMDLSLIATQMQEENEDSNSLFFNTLINRTALMGHSMGGGAAFLAAENNTSITTLIGFAAAETNPSAISAAANVEVPTLLFAGDDDCVTPPEDHQIPMYENLGAGCKTLISIVNGGHCYFANDNFNCNFGESFCNASLNITRAEQQSVTFDFLKLWLDHTLYGNQDALTILNDSLQLSNRVDFEQSCNATYVQSPNKEEELQLFPNPVVDVLTVSTFLREESGMLYIYNSLGTVVYQTLVNNNTFQVDLSHFPNGTYFVLLYQNEIPSSRTFIKIGVH